jgi:predicted nucleic acid-binding protein
MNAAVLSPHLIPIADALIARSNGKYDAEFLRILVANVANEFEGARVRDYIEVLVAKEATDALRKLDALRPITS